VKDRLTGRKGRSAYSQRKADPLIFGAKMVPYLQRADPSFRNLVTGSGSRAKCSNILQDTMLDILMKKLIMLCDIMVIPEMLSFIMISAIMLSAIMLNVIIMSVIILIVAAPNKKIRKFQF
jgi:hypothetical protein